MKAVMASSPKRLRSKRQRQRRIQERFSLPHHSITTDTRAVLSVVLIYGLARAATLMTLLSGLLSGATDVQARFQLYFGLHEHSSDSSRPETS